jgi:carbon storage regulator
MLSSRKSPVEGRMMLVLTRKTKEVIRIGPDIYVTVLQIDRGKVRLGINAPADVEVVRLELERQTNPPPIPPDDMEGEHAGS